MINAARLSVAFLLIPLLAAAHHNPVVYDGKTTVTISGTVTAARYGNPHSQYAIDVTNDDGEIEKWVLMTEDPRDAKRGGLLIWARGAAHRHRRAGRARVILAPLDRTRPRT